MAVLLIPTPTTAAYQEQKVRLEGRDFVFHFSLNEREDRYYLAIHDEENEPIATSIKMIANWPLLRSLRFRPELPPGELIAMDLTGDDSPPGVGELGQDKRVTLTYFTSDEVEAAEA
jgi:hypothetical protein